MKLQISLDRVDLIGIVGAGITAEPDREKAAADIKRRLREAENE